MKDNRRRDMTLTIRVTEKEKLYIKKRAKKAGLSTTDYIVRLSLETPIYIPVNMQPFLLELKRIGNNINQLTKKLMQRFLHRIISMNLLMQLKN